MGYNIETRGEGKNKKFLVINESTDRQMGHFIKKEEAVAHADFLNKRDNVHRPEGELLMDGK